MTKAERLSQNKIVDDFLADFLNREKKYCYESQLRSCQASVSTYTMVDTGEVVHLLTSYSTLVAIINGDTCYDFLRKVYGYTATSAQHIGKFQSDYLNGIDWDKRKYYCWTEI